MAAPGSPPLAVQPPPLPRPPHPRLHQLRRPTRYPSLFLSTPPRWLIRYRVLEFGHGGVCSTRGRRQAGSALPPPIPLLSSGQHLAFLPLLGKNQMADGWVGGLGGKFRLNDLLPTALHNVCSTFKTRPDGEGPLAFFDRRSRKLGRLQHIDATTLALLLISVPLVRLCLFNFLFYFFSRKIPSTWCVRGSSSHARCSSCQADVRWQEGNHPVHTPRDNRWPHCLLDGLGLPYVWPDE
jgi:hypothetical protein